MPLVSIVIPVHNAGRYLGPCLTSVLGQTHRDLQVVCVDDGSSDRSAAVLDRHADADARLQVINQPNVGPGGARNTGLDRAAGEYLMFVDADDLIPPEAVQRHLNALRSSTSEFSTGRVMRLTGTHVWPSAMHDNALSRPATGAHLYRDPSLLFDTTSWNKLFRRDYWTAHRYAFAESVFFEDVALMTEAHCRATSVEVLGEVVYRWRRRDDGNPSITMRREDPGLLRDRISSLQRVRRLLGEIAPGSVRRAAEAKFLRHDLGSYLAELEDAPADLRREFVRLVGLFLAESPERVVDGLPPHLRVAYRLVSGGGSDELVAYLAFLREHDWRLPVRRRWPVPRADLGPAGPVVPRKYGSARRRMPLRVSVCSLSWQGDTLVIEGVGFIDGMSLGHPMAALRRLQLVDADIGRERHVWLAPRRLPPMGPRTRMSPSYEWSGFRARIPLALLDPGPGLRPTRWQVNLQVMTWGAGSGTALSPPDPCIADVHHHSSGLAVRVVWAGGKRLVLEAIRAAYTLHTAARAGGRLQVWFRSSGLRANQPVALRLTSPIGEVADFPLTSAPASPVDDGSALIDLDRLVGGRADRPRSFEVGVVTADGRAVVVTGPDEEIRIPLGGDSIVVTADGPGGARIIIVTGPRVVVTGLGWSDGLLRLDLSCQPNGRRPTLVWCHGTGDEIHPIERRGASDLVAWFDLLAVPGPEGVCPLRAGRWGLMTVEPDGSRRPVTTSRGQAVTGEHRLGPEIGRVRLGPDPQGNAVMSVEARPALERGTIGQERLQRGAYRRALRSALTESILLEAWGGKSFSDNPRALLEEASPVWQNATVVVAVADASIGTPPGVRTVLAGSREHYAERARARLIVSNDCLPRHFVKRAGQRYLQTWHGTPLKRIGLDIERIRFRNKNYQRELRAESAKWDWLISPNPFSTEVFRRAFAFAGPILETGYPRNDLLAGGDESRRARRRDQARRWLRIDPDQQVVLWAPPGATTPSRPTVVTGRRCCPSRRNWRGCCRTTPSSSTEVIIC